MFADYINHDLDCKRLINLPSKNRANTRCNFSNLYT